MKEIFDGDERRGSLCYCQYQRPPCRHSVFLTAKKGEGEDTDCERKNEWRGERFYCGNKSDYSDAVSGEKADGESLVEKPVDNDFYAGLDDNEGAESQLHLHVEYFATKEKRHQNGQCGYALSQPQFVQVRFGPFIRSFHGDLQRCEMHQTARQKIIKNNLLSGSFI
ncbi:MAG: hypothetical protein A2921_01210 [Candidatus Magasanikbacteria bacterium RIFCSPLOWO2_01_FULL_43_20b]|uniref:Uncharacterized protein n=1 Tax=Candidatus Magasanikbacteria bacterium RIFCSPLOWO2_12_FULL_43_12 TaxID=1798692 RepID=A0A1F6MTP3_9BACT|nr:MAG: hypothetical protein A3C74_00825 [Candidatus Magasanikbacteria bacterium RIFCSPHIGHO2_02_FULL_44_13]OGH72715.1 MAG: hypothetical protein A3I93_03960 [Candidatus Magasanikbacteria bacterium RIFCSPLOWO2_02_FULL_43_22]OGH72861.1 MAG: hypothetical protein A2921_01210 [Candidatus Magasanikbacteria bacterium RIFCSPLOWO2_01_FULL_43_20b]OGH74991.1 MAG: hypothetical protein A3G00_01410 [Candidatus Magasanikbacteria bacterium RIFCSPLOWO2_12_FULL_43_12]